jgi:hypothetical protein
MRFRVVPSDGQPFLHEQDAPLKVGATFFTPPREPGTQGFFKVTAIEPGGEHDVDAVVRVHALDS